MVKYQKRNQGKDDQSDMLAELKMALEVDKPGFGYYQSSNMQGILMERLAAPYAARLHEQGLKPYSQYVLAGEQNVWVVKALTREAYQEIILPLLREDFTEFYIEKKEMHVKIRSKELRTMGRQELLEGFYGEGCSRYLNLEFLTPTAFKSNGRYVIMPDPRYLYQSLMNKYSASSEDMEMYDEETLEQLAAGSHITRYRLRSTVFPLEGVNIPSFLGQLSIRVSGPETMARYAGLLARFGEYSGVGIKTALGMGAMRIREWREKHD